VSDYIIFTIGEAHYALDVSHIERIDQIPPLTPMPNAHPFVEGMMMYQDNTLKVINFRKMTNAYGQEPADSSQKLLIYRDIKGQFAIKVDTIKDITAFEESAIKPYAHPVSVGQHLSTRGVIEHNKKLVVVIESVEFPTDGAV
jgi:two-component system chemotaxis response regulator CheV